MPFVSHAAAKREKKIEQNETVTAVKADGTIQLSTRGAAVFRNVVWPDAALAESWMASHLLQTNLSFTPDDEDRYGRLQIDSDMAESALRDGIAVIYANEGRIEKSWHEAEEAARAAKRGVWGKPDFVVTPGNAAQHVGSFHAVEGVITRIYAAKTATYLNFGEDWHSDFSVTIPARNRRSFESWMDALKPGSHVLVRGYIYEENGPMITLSRPDNLETQ